MEFNCPGCKIPIGITADMNANSRFSIKIRPAPGSLMDAQTVAGLIAKVAEMFKPDFAFVEHMSTDGAELQVDFLIVRENPQ